MSPRRAEAQNVCRVYEGLLFLVICFKKPLAHVIADNPTKRIKACLLQFRIIF